jgi:hypothetical protein
VKVLICGSFWKGSLEQSYADAFSSIGCQVVPFDWERMEWGSGPIRKVTSRLSAKWVGTKLVDLCAAEQPGLIFIIKGRRIPPETIAAIKRVASTPPLINFNPDSPWDAGNGSPQLIDSISLYDCHFTWSRVLMSRFGVARARRIEYLPFAYDPSLHWPLEEPRPEADLDAVFIGTHDLHRDKLLAELTGCKIAIWGNGWQRAKHVPREWIRGEAIYGSDATRQMHRALASINILRPQNAGSHNMRTFEIPATRNLMLTTRTAEQEEFLHEGSEMLCYESTDELRDHLVALREAPEHAESVREAAYARVRDETYAKRARQILAALNLNP